MRILFTIALLLPLPVKAEESAAPSAEKAPQMIVVGVKLVEISRTKMRELGVEFTALKGQRGEKVEGELAFQQLPPAAGIGFVEALTKNRIARIIADPKIAALSGQEAHLSVGSQSEASEAEAGANEQAGIELRMTPTLLADGRVQVELFLKYSWQERDKDGPATDNRVRHFSLDTGVVSNPQESSLLSGLVLEPADSSYVLIVTPDLVEPTAAKPQGAIR